MCGGGGGECKLYEFGIIVYCMLPLCVCVRACMRGVCMTVCVYTKKCIY